VRFIVDVHLLVNKNQFLVIVHNLTSPAKIILNAFALNIKENGKFVFN
jgi:hypothetical protein